VQQLPIDFTYNPFRESYLRAFLLAPLFTFWRNIHEVTYGTRLSVLQWLNDYWGNAIFHAFLDWENEIFHKPLGNIISVGCLTSLYVWPFMHHFLRLSVTYCTVQMSCITRCVACRSHTFVCGNNVNRDVMLGAPRLVAEWRLMVYSKEDLNAIDLACSTRFIYLFKLQ